jgi:hypothetical protein
MTKIAHVSTGDLAAQNIAALIAGRPDERQIIVDDGLAYGPLRDLHTAASLDARAAWLDRMFEVAGHADDAQDCQAHKSLATLAPDPDEIALIWCGQNGMEQTLLRALCHAWPQAQLWISEVPLFTADFEGRTAVAVCSVEKLRQAQARPLTQDERNALADEWLALTTQDHTLRLYLEGKLASCDESFFDETLLWRCGPDFKRAIHVVGQVMGEAADYVSDGFLFYRLRVLIARGALVAENREAGIRELWVRRG